MTVMAMQLTRPFASGDRILIEQEGHGAIGKIEDIRTPAEFAEFAGLEPFSALYPAEVLRPDSNVTRTAVISYYDLSGSQLMFLAVEIGGEWWDLQQRRLIIRHFAMS
jgi:hypothetical protein